METQDVASLLASGEYSDLAILCQGKSFKVHRAIVCSQSSVIDSALRYQSKETQNIFKIDDFDADTVERMIEFMYGIKRPFSTADDVRSAQKAVLEANTLPQENEKPQFMDIFRPVFEAEKKDMVVRINASRIADHFKVPSMTKFVHDEINDYFQTNWQEGIFVGALEFTLAGKASSNLLSVFAKAAAEHIGDLVCYDGVTEWMANRDFLVQFINASVERIEGLMTALKTQADLATTQTERLDTANNNMKQCLKTLNNMRRCRSCYARFSCRIKRLCSGAYEIRCSECNAQT